MFQQMPDWTKSQVIKIKDEITLYFLFKCKLGNLIFNIVYFKKNVKKQKHLELTIKLCTLTQHRKFMKISGKKFICQFLWW